MFLMYLALTLESDKIRKDTVCSLNRISKELGLEHRKVIAQEMGMLLYSELNKLATADNMDKFSQCDRHITVDFLKSPSFIIQRFGEIIIHRFCPNPISHSEYKKAILVELEKWEKIGQGDQTVMNIFLDLLSKIVSEVENKFLI